MLEELKLEKSIKELDLKEGQGLILKLLNIIEDQGKVISEMKFEIQNLRDENARLKGNNPKPKFPMIKKNCH